MNVLNYYCRLGWVPKIAPFVGILWYLSLHIYHRHFMKNLVNPNCPECGEATHTLEHWLACPGTACMVVNFHYCWTTSFIHCLNISGQSGCTDKAFSVMAFCTCLQQQPQQKRCFWWSEVSFCKQISSPMCMLSEWDHWQQLGPLQHKCSVARCRRWQVFGPSVWRWTASLILIVTVMIHVFVSFSCST